MHGKIQPRDLWSHYLGFCVNSSLCRYHHRITPTLGYQGVDNCVLHPLCPSCVYRRTYASYLVYVYLGKTKTAPDDDDSEAVEGVEDVICRLAQGHPTRSPKRWETITQKLNRTMRKKRISGQPLKALLAKEGLCIPQCWVTEKEQAEQDRARARLQKAEEKLQGGFSLSLFGKKKTPGATLAGPKQPGEAAEDGLHDSDDAGETDTELESDDEEGAAAEKFAGTEEGQEPGYKHCSLSKYEVFSLMRRVHDRAGAGLTEAEDVVEEMERAEKMVGMLYEHLPAQTLKGMSQQSRIKANLRQDSLVYGEIDLPHFLKVNIF